MSMALERWLCLGLLGLQIVPYIYSSRSMKSHYSIGHSDHMKVHPCWCLFGPMVIRMKVGHEVSNNSSLKELALYDIVVFRESWMKVCCLINFHPL